MKIKAVNKLFLVIIILFTIMFIPKPNVSALQNGSEDLVVLRKALLNQISYESKWLDINSDSEFDVADIIRLKRYYSKADVEIEPIKYIDITLISGNRETVTRQYQPKYYLPALESPYMYWKSGNSYYNEHRFVSLYSNATFTAVESKKDVDFPIIDF